MDEQCTMDYSNGLEDMEDMFGGDVADGVHRRMNKENIVVPKVKKRAANKQAREPFVRYCACLNCTTFQQLKPVAKRKCSNALCFAQGGFRLDILTKFEAMLTTPNSLP